MVQAGTNGQTNVTQSDSTGNQKMDISPIDTINSETPLEDITKLYTNLSHQYAGIVDKSAQDVSNRQTDLIGNDFGGATDPYNYSQYYMPASTDFQANMRIEGTQRALEEGMSRAKAEAEARAAAAKQSYANESSRLQKLQQAKNPTIVQTGTVGGSTSASELLNFANITGAENADELAGQANAQFLSDNLVGSPANWNIREYRDIAKASTLQKFGLSQDQYNNMSQAEKDAFWNRADVGSYWTNRYAYTYAERNYGKDVANNYQQAYEQNYTTIKNIFNQIKSDTEDLSAVESKINELVSQIKTIQIDENTDPVLDKTVTPQIMSGHVIYDTVSYNFIESGSEAESMATESEKEHSIYNYVNKEDGAKIKKLYDEWKGYTQPTFGWDQNAFDEHKKVETELQNTIANALSTSQSAVKRNAPNKKIEFKIDNSPVNTLLESAFGVDLESIKYLKEMQKADPAKFNGLLSDYSLVLTYGQVFEIADGKKTYHTANGDKVLEAGTYVMYTLPGFQDSEGNITEPNLKRYLELRKGNFDATYDMQQLQEETKKALEGYQKVVMAALTAAYRADCDVTSNLIHSDIYSSSPTSKDVKGLTIFNGHTVGEIITKYSELATKDPEAAYAMFTEIVKKASSNSGSMMANYGGQLTTVSNKDAAGRDMVGSELTSGSERASKLFDDDDIKNLTVEDANALLITLGTSMDRWNNGSKDGNVPTDFLTADGNNWFKTFFIEGIKGVVGLVDLVGNLAWSGITGLGVQIGTLVEGRGGKWTQEEIDFVSKNGRWWGWGGITGNWTGNASLYDQFVGDYKPTAFGYGEENQKRMTDNLNHVVNPILEDLWFGEGATTQKAMGVGRAGDEGINYRSISNFTASMAGFVAGIWAGNAAASGIAKAAAASSQLISKASSAMAMSLKSNTARAFLKNSTNVATKMLKGVQKTGEFLAGSGIDDATRAASGADDVVRASSGYSDDVVKNAVSQYVDDSASAINPAKNSVAGISKASQHLDDVVNTTTDIMHVQQVFSGAADDYTKALGSMSVWATGETLSGVADDIWTYSQKLFKQLIKSIPGLSADDAASIIKDLGKVTTKRALNLAHISAATKIPVNDLANLSDEALTIASNLMAYKNGVKLGRVPTQIAKFLDGKSSDDVIELIKELSERANIKAAANHGVRVWGNDDTVRFLARNGWDSKRINLLMKDWLKDQIQDLTSDVLYGYIKPTVTNEGTDRETIDEYFTNPVNYLFNLGASGLQYMFRGVGTRVGQAINNHSLDRARNALSVAVESGADSAAVEKLSMKVLKKVDRAMNLADQALEKGRTLHDIKEITDKSLAYCDEAVSAINDVSIRNIKIMDFDNNIKTIPQLSKQLNENQLGFLRTLYSTHVAGTTAANARYFQLKKALGAYNNGLASITDQKTNGRIWRLLVEGRENYLNELNAKGQGIDRAQVTLGQQKKIYKAMVDHVMKDDIAKTIPGLRNSLDNFLDGFWQNASINNYEVMRAGYLPIESFLNLNDSTPAALRGFSAGEWVLDASTANPYLERSEALKDSTLIEAILRGDKEITLKDDKGVDIVDDDGNVQTRLLNPDGLNFLDAAVNSHNAAWYHKNLDPILGKNNGDAGSAAAKNGFIVVNQKGMIGVALDKSLDKVDTEIKKIESSVLGDVKKASGAAQAAAIKRSNKRKEIIAEKNPDVKKAVVAKKASQVIVQNELERLESLNVNLTKRQQEFPAAIFGYTNGTGKIDIDAGNIIFDNYTDIVKKDIKKFQNGELAVGSKIDSAFRRYDTFAWKNSRDELFNKIIPGYKHTYEVDTDYYKMLEYCANTGTAPTKDMVMRRLLWTEHTAPVDKDGNVFKSVSEKTKKVKGEEVTITKTYEWQSPFKYAKTSYINEHGVENAMLRDFQARGYGEGVNTRGFYYVPKDGANPWAADQFDKLVLNTPKNIATAKDIITQNAERLNLLPLTQSGKLTKTSANMLDMVTAELVTRAKGNGGGGLHELSFSEYVDQLSTALANSAIIADAFDPESASYEVFKKLNSIENHGVNFKELREYIENKMWAHSEDSKEFAKYLEAESVIGSMIEKKFRAISNGENFDPEMAFGGADADDGLALGVLFNSSSEAVMHNSEYVDLNPVDRARANEIIEKGIVAAEATEDEIQRLGLGYLGRPGERSGAYKRAQKVVALNRGYQNNPDDFRKALGSFNKVLDEFLATKDFETRDTEYKKVLETLNGAKDKKGNVKTKGLITEVGDLINEASKKSKVVKRKIDRYAKSREHRQKAYEVQNESDKFDAIRAYGATNEGYTVVDTPLQYRSASMNVYTYGNMLGETINSDFSRNVNSLASLEDAFHEARKKQDAILRRYHKLEKAIGPEKAKKSSLYKEVIKVGGEVDEARKRWSNRQEELGIDLTNDMQHWNDWSGLDVAYDKMMLEGGKAGTRIDQLMNAIEKVKKDLGGNSTKELTDNLDSAYERLSQLKAETPDWMFYHPSEAASLNESMETSLTRAMALTGGSDIEQAHRLRILPDGTREIVEDIPTNGVFTDEMLNSVASVRSGKDITFGRGNPHRLDLDIAENGPQINQRNLKSDIDFGKTTVDFGDYNNITFEIEGLGVDDTGEFKHFTLRKPNGEYVDPATLSPVEISQLDDALAAKGGYYRVGILDDGSDIPDAKYNYGDKQSEFIELSDKLDRATKVAEYHQLKAEKGDNDDLVKSIIASYGLTDAEVSMTYKKAQANLESARKKLSTFEKKNSDLRQEVKSTGHKEFTYGAAEPEFKKLSAISDKANAVLEYKNMESKLGRAPSAQERADLEAFNAAHKGGLSGDTTLTYDDKLAELNKFKSDNKLSDSDVKVSYEDAQTNAWIAQKELDDFKKSHSQEITTIKPEATDINSRLEKLRQTEGELVQRVADARSLGDLKENEEYHAARRELAQTRDEIAELEEMQKRGNKVSTDENRSNITIVPMDKSELAGVDNITFAKEDVSSYGSPMETKLLPVLDENGKIKLDENGKEMYKEYPAVRVIKLKDDEERGIEDFANLSTEGLSPLYEEDPNYTPDALYTEWLSYTDDLDDINEQIKKKQERVAKAGKKVEENADKILNERVEDPEDATKKTTYNKEANYDAKDQEMKEKATPEEYARWRSYKDFQDYARKYKEEYERCLRTKKTPSIFRDHNGVIYLPDNSPNIAGYASHKNQLEARGYKPLKKKADVPPVDEKLDAKNRKAMQKAITKNRHAGDIRDSKLEGWDLPRDEDGNIIFDEASKKATITNLETIYNQVKKLTGLDISRDGLLMSNEYADLLTRIPDESVRAGMLQKGISAMSSVSQSIQNAQLAGGFSFVNAYGIAQLRDVIMRNPRAIKEYIKVVGSMRNSAAAEMFALQNNPLLSRFTLETGDISIVNDFAGVVSSKPGFSDGGVTQNIVNNTLNLKKDWVDQRVKQNKSIPKALVGIVSKDVQNTIFEDATFANAMPVLRAKMLVANYDAAMNQLSHRFPKADVNILEKAAIKMSYAKTQSFFDPYHTIGKKVTDVLDNTFTKEMRTFAASFTNSKSQTTLLDTLTNFFFAMRYKMMLAGRVYNSATSAVSIPKAKLKGKDITSLTADNMDEVLNTVGTSFMNQGAAWGGVSLAACAATAAVTAAALGIPTAWDDISWTDEYDGGFKIPNILLKFQTIGQIWLPNSGQFDLSKGIDWGHSVFGMSVDPNEKMYGIDTMSSIFTLQNSFFRTIDRTVNPETYYAAPQRGVGLIGQELGINPQGLNNILNWAPLRAVGDEAIGSNLLSPFKAMYEIIMDSTYFGNNIWEKKYLPDGKENPNYDPGRNFAAMTMHLLGLDQVLDGGKGYNDWVKGKGTPTYVEQDQIGTVAGSGILQHEFLTAARSMINGDYLDAVTEAGELPIKSQNLSSKARTEFNTSVKNIIAGYSDEYKKVTTNPDSNNDMKDLAYKDFAKKSADVVATWSKKYGYILGQNQNLVPYVTRTMMAMLSGEYDDDMFYVQDAYWKASADAQIEGVTSDNYWLDDVDLKDWIAAGKSAEDFAAEKQKRTKAYNDAQDAEYEARKALIEANYDAEGNEKIKGLQDFLTDRYGYSDLKAEQRALNKEVYSSIHAKLDMPVGDFDNYKEMKTYYETLIANTTSKSQKVNLAMRYNTYVFDLIAPYAEKYGANIINDAYYNGKGLANDLADYVILPADQKYYGKTPVSNYIKDVFNVGFRNDGALPSDKEVIEKFIVAQNLMMKGSVSSSVAVLDSILKSIKKGTLYASNTDYNKIINMRAYLSARSR